MNRFSRSIQLFKASWSVLQKVRELLALPLISGVVSFLLMLTFAVPGFLSLSSETSVDQFGRTTESLGPSPLTYVIGAVFYVVSAFAVIFFNAALVYGANERLNGGNPTISSALAGAWQRKGLIFQWALVSATVSMIIRQIQENGGLVGRILGGVIGFAWGVVTFLVLPTVVIEGVGVKEAFTKSTSAVRETWGENLIGQGGLGIAGFLAALPLIALSIGGAFLLSTSVALGLVVIALAMLGFVALVVTMSALGVVYQTALYRFATLGTTDGFEPATLTAAFAPKSAGRFGRS